MKKTLLVLGCVLVVLSGCANLSKIAKGTLIGSGAGLAAGAGIGALIGGEKGA